MPAPQEWHVLENVTGRREEVALEKQTRKNSEGLTFDNDDMTVP